MLNDMEDRRLSVWDGKTRSVGFGGKAGPIDHSRPVQIYHQRALIVNGLEWSGKTGEIWSRGMVFPKMP